MEGYRVLIGNLQDATWYEEIPVTRINFSKVLNGTGKCDISTSPNPERSAFKDKISSDLLKPGRSTIYIEKDGTIVGAYILWEVFVIYPSNRLRLIGEGFWSYFRKRIINEDALYTNTDQLLIGKNLINGALTAMGQLGKIVGLSVTGTLITSGILVDRNYYGYQRRIVAEAVEDLANKEDGFDFDITSTWIAGSNPPTIANEYQQYYPQKGTVGDIIFDLDANLLRISRQEKAQKVVNRMFMIGGGTAEDTVLTTSYNMGSMSAENYPLLDHKLVKKDITEVSTLVTYGMRELAKRSQLYEILTVELDPQSVETRLGAFTTGDIVRVKADRGFISINKYYRIQTYDVWVNESSNEERISVSLSTVEATI